MHAKSFVKLHNIIEVFQISFYSNIAFFCLLAIEFTNCQK